jgi:hypothetical protein
VYTSNEKQILPFAKWKGNPTFQTSHQKIKRCYIFLFVTRNGPHFSVTAKYSQSSGILFPRKLVFASILIKFLLEIGLISFILGLWPTLPRSDYKEKM